MKKILLLFVLAAVATFSMASCAKIDKEQKEKALVIGLNAQYPPFESYTKDRKLEGFDIDLAKALEKQLHYPIQIKDMNFDALILSLKQEKIDLIISGMSITASREKEIAMIPYQGETIKNLKLAFWGDIPPSIRTLEDLSQVVVQVGTYQESYLHKIKGVKAKSLEGVSELIMDIKYGKSEAALIESHTVDFLQKKFPEIHILTIDLPEKDWVFGLGIGVKKEHKKLIEKVQSAMTKLKEEGVIADLEKKWFQGGSNVS